MYTPFTFRSNPDFCTLAWYHSVFILLVVNEVEQTVMFVTCTRVVTKLEWSIVTANYAP